MERPFFYEKRDMEDFIGPICEQPYPAHVHDVVEIICLTEGTLSMTISGEQVTLTPGDIAVAFPAVPHSYDTVPENARGLAMIFRPDTIAEFSPTFRGMTPVNPLIRKAQQPAMIGTIVANLQKISAKEANPLRLGYLHLFLSYLFLCMPVKPMEKPLHSGLTYQALHYIADHFTEPLSLESTARALGISRIHLSHIFSQQLHINFRQHINGLRINYAQTLLKDPSYSISQVVYLSGYGNPRTFNRAFVAQCGMSPGQYRTVRLKMKNVPEDAE